MRYTRICFGTNFCNEIKTCCQMPYQTKVDFISTYDCGYSWFWIATNPQNMFLFIHLIVFEFDWGICVFFRLGQKSNTNLCRISTGKMCTMWKWCVLTWTIHFGLNGFIMWMFRLVLNSFPIFVWGATYLFFLFHTTRQRQITSFKEISGHCLLFVESKYSFANNKLVIDLFFFQPFFNDTKQSRTQMPRR